MKAVIMAGGEGSRLRPLTCDCPKPMVPLMDKPVMSYALELLRRHHIQEAAVTLQYLPDRVQDYFGDGSDFDIALRYYVEKTPMGTAGSVRQAADFLTETFIVLSGDGVTDCDLTDAVRFHRERGAMATMVIKHVESPLEYGLVVANSDGRIRRFVEKPGWEEVFSDTVNTGIYILEPEALRRIPSDRPCDFGREFFPALLQEGAPLFAYTMNGYWCDIGDISAYLRAHADAMDGRINLPALNRSASVFRMAGSRVDRGAVLEGPCFIGENAVVHEGARIGPYSVLGAGSVVGAHASVKRSVLWPQARLAARTQARGCILARNAFLGEGAGAFEESVLGSGASLGARGTLLPGVKIWPQKNLPEGIRMDANLVWGGGERPCFIQGRLPIKNPAYAVRAAQAYAAALRPSSVLLLRSASPVAHSCSMAVESGLMAQGVQVLNAGCGTLPQLRIMLQLLHTDGALFIDGEAMRPLASEGTELNLTQRRRVEALLLRQDYERSFASAVRTPISAGRSDLMYVGFLLNAVDSDVLRRVAPRVAVFAPDEPLLSTAERVLEKAGCTVRAEWEDEMMDLSPGETGLWLTHSGEGMRLSGEDGTLTDIETSLLTTWALLESGARRIILPMDASHAAEALAAQYSAEIIRVKGERASFMSSLAREDYRQFLMRFDGLYAALVCLERLARSGKTLSAWLHSAPHLARQVRSIPVSSKDRGRVMSRLMEEENSTDAADGLFSFARDGGWAWVAPVGQQEEYRIVAESPKEEIACELCDLYADRILNALHPDAVARQ